MTKENFWKLLKNMTGQTDEEVLINLCTQVVLLDEKYWGNDHEKYCNVKNLLYHAGDTMKLQDFLELPENIQIAIKKVFLS
jgi:hypothetical protein